MAAVECPALLMQADFDYTADGILNGAMSAEMAEQAVALLKDCTYIKVESNHVVNLDKPQEFIDILNDFFSE